MRLLVGLGNPGSRYEGTRHNLGFEAVDRLAREAEGRWSRSPADCWVVEGRLFGQPILLAKPQTYMNLSGRVVAELAGEHELAPPDIVVYLDDIALPLGSMRIRERGGDGGHRGLASVLDWLGTEEVSRVRLGIRPAAEPGDLSDFVLSRFTPEERLVVETVLDRIVEATRSLLGDGVAKAMSLYNTSPGPRESGSNDRGV